MQGERIVPITLINLRLHAPAPRGKNGRDGILEMLGFDFDWITWWPLIAAAALSTWLVGVFRGQSVLSAIEGGGRFEQSGCLGSTWVHFPDIETSKRVATWGFCFLIVGLGVAYWVPEYLAYVKASALLRGVAKTVGVLVALPFGASRLAMFYLGSLSFSLGLLCSARLIHNQLKDPRLYFANEDAVRFLIIICLFWSSFALARFVFYGLRIAGPDAHSVYRSVMQMASAVLTGVALFKSLYEDVKVLQEAVDWMRSIIGR